MISHRSFDRFFPASLLIGYALLALAQTPAAAAALSAVQGVVRDQHGLPVPAALVRLMEAGTAGGRQVTTDGQGRYAIGGIEAGRYELRFAAPGFRIVTHVVDVRSGDSVVVNARLELGDVAEQVEVHSDPAPAAAGAQLLARDDLDRIPGALRTGSRAALLSTAPSAVVAHDQLHVRGGHDVGYEIDGVPIPSATIGSTLGLPFEAKDVKAIEFRATDYSAAFGDRLHGQVNIVTRSGFERPRAVELLALAGQQGTYETAFSLGDHSDRVAYFAQASANRTDFGLTPPGLPADHDRAGGLGAAGKLWAPLSASNLLTITATARGGEFQVPRGAEGDTGFARLDRQAERDLFVAGQWHHAGSGKWAWWLTPYYHFSRVALDPVSDAVGPSSDDRRVHYAGAKAEGVYHLGVHDVRAGTSVLAALFSDRFRLGDAAITAGGVAEGGAGAVPAAAVRQTGLTQAIYVEDRWRPSTGVTVTGGLRLEQSRAYRVESAIEPRVELAARIPGTPLTAHVGAGRFFRPPPLETLGVGGAQFAEAGDQALLLARAERSTQWEAGVSATALGTTVEARYYRNQVRHFLDHEQLGNSAVFLPVNVAEALLHGMEVTVASRVGSRLHARLVYALGFAEARGGISGGLGDLSPGEAVGGYYYLDHDQRHTAVASLEYLPTASTWAHVAIHYGSGLLAGDGLQHLPSHLTADASLGLTASRHVSVAVEVENLTDRRYFVNLSSEFNGTHVARPRSAMARLRLSF